MGCASRAPCHPPLLPLRATRSSIPTASYEFSRFLFHCRFFSKLRRGPAHFKASDGGAGNGRFSERPVCFEGHWWHYPDDDLVLPHARIAAAIRPELSRSIPRFERDLYHADGSDSPEGKTKHATNDRRVADQRRHRARFAQLAIEWRATASVAIPRFGKRSARPKDTVKNSRARQQRPQSFQGCQIDLVDPVDSRQLDFWVIEFCGETLFETRVIWRRIGAANIASNNLGGLAQFPKGPFKIRNCEATCLPVRHCFTGLETIKVDRAVDIFPADRVGKLLKMPAPIVPQDRAPALSIFRRTIICPGMHLEKTFAFGAPVTENLVRPPALE